MSNNEHDILLDVKDLHTHFTSGYGKNKVTVKAVNGVSFQDVYKRQDGQQCWGLVSLKKEKLMCALEPPAGFRQQPTS